MLIHSTNYKPKIIPLKGDCDPANIDRAQGIDPTVALNREKIKEIGNKDVVGYLKKSPSVTYRLTQHEYGSLEFYKKLANLSNSAKVVSLDDFKDSTFDICAYMFDDADVFKGTVVYPGLRLSGLSLTIGDPDAIISRTFDVAGEQAIIWQGNNKYYIYLRAEVGSGESTKIITIGQGDFANYPEPVQDPILGTYIVKLYRIRDNELQEPDFDYDDETKTITVQGCEFGDIIKVLYTASSYITGQVPFEVNTTDLPALEANSSSIYLYIPATGKPSASDYIYRLQSITLDVKLDREDQKELGNREVVVRGIRGKTVTVTLGRVLESFKLEEVLSGRNPDFGKIDVQEFSSDITLVVKLYSDYTKQAFKLGLKTKKLSPSDLRGGTAGIDAYVSQNNTLIGEDLIITDDESELQE